VSQGQRFRRRALRRGYKVDEVDTFLDRVEATLAGDSTGAPVSAQEVHDIVFRVRFGGYDEWQVDLHLDRVERQLAEHEERGGVLARGLDPRSADPRSADPRSADPHPADLRMAPPAQRVGPERTVPPPERLAPEQMVPPPGRMTPERMVAPPDRLAPERMAPERIPPDRMGPDRIAPDRMPPDRMPPDRMPPDRLGPDRVPPPERIPPLAAPPVPMPPPAPPRPMPAPAGPPPRDQAYSRYDEPTYGGTFDKGGYEPSSRHVRGEMTTEIRMDRGGSEPAVYGGPPSPPPPSTEVARIDQMRRTFQLRRFGSGYDRMQVDRLFEGVVASLSGRGGPVSDGELDPSQFDLVPGGYFEAEVDAALKEVRDIIMRRR
jgi:DivIVA domain-containing protein